MMRKQRLDWNKLLSGERRKPSKSQRTETRRPLERDYDRILFSTPLRRLADKTQVFPLEQNDSVRTRLTHSFEVSNIARSIGTVLAYQKVLPSVTGIIERDLAAILAAAALVHDVGNPPFGHQGERAIRDWVSKHSATLFKPKLTAAMQADFVHFEGNAQTFRLVTKLQLINDDYGLNLCYGTLATILKYVVPAHKADKRSEFAGRKKPGFFQSEKRIVEDVFSKVGLKNEQRHPLAYLVEACDDLCYSIVDAEDAVKKSLASYPDLADFLKQATGDDEDESDNDSFTEAIVADVKRDRTLWQSSGTNRLSPAELNDLSMQKFRVHAMHAVITAVTTVFVENLSILEKGMFVGSLVKKSPARIFIKRLKEFDTRVAYRHRTVLRTELDGHRVIPYLMDCFWAAISANGRADGRDLSPLHSFVFGKISENYRRIYGSTEGVLPARYRQLQLLTDMISGMTDGFAMTLYEEFQAIHR